MNDPNAIIDSFQSYDMSIHPPHMPSQENDLDDDINHDLSDSQMTSSYRNKFLEAKLLDDEFNQPDHDSDLLSSLASQLDMEYCHDNELNSINKALNDLQDWKSQQKQQKTINSLNDMNNQPETDENNPSSTNTYDSDVKESILLYEEKKNNDKTIESLQNLIDSSKQRSFQQEIDKLTLISKKDDVKYLSIEELERELGEIYEKNLEVKVTL